jgi:hypothetical protein
MKNSQATADSQALLTAVGLIWGWLEQDLPQQALILVKACLVRWPEESVLHLLHRQCLTLLGMPWTDKKALHVSGIPPAWAALLNKLQARHEMRVAAERRDALG